MKVWTSLPPTGRPRIRISRPTRGYNEERINVTSFAVPLMKCRTLGFASNDRHFMSHLSRHTSHDTPLTTHLSRHTSHDTPLTTHLSRQTSHDTHLSRHTPLITRGWSSPPEDVHSTTCVAPLYSEDSYVSHPWHRHHHPSVWNACYPHTTSHS
jgi:hypothetical protein